MIYNQFSFCRCRSWPFRGCLPGVPVVALAVVVLALVSKGGAEPVAMAEGYEGVSRARHDLKLAFSVEGRVGKVMVKRGDAVKSGQVLLELEDRQGEIAVEVWKLRSESELQVKVREEQLRLAELDERRLEDMLKKSAAAPVEYERAQINAVIARLQLDAAKQEREEAGLQYRHALAQHQHYIQTAPRDGVVEELIVERGEAVKAGEPVLRMVVTDPLLVDVYAPLDRTLDLKVGDRAWVVTTVGGSVGQPSEGRVTFISAVSDTASETRLVQVELPNPARLPSGSKVRVSFRPPG